MHRRVARAAVRALREPLVLIRELPSRRREPRQDPAHRLAARRNRLRSGDGKRDLFFRRDRRDHGTAAHLRLSRAARQSSPLTAVAFPEITDNGKTYTFKVKPGIVFAADPAFKGKRRELTVDDYIYAIKRLVDPGNRSPNAFYVAGKIVGLDEAAAAGSKSNAKFDYSAKITGLEAIDRRTLRIRLKSSDYTFANIMALPALRQSRAKLSKRTQAMCMRILWAPGRTCMKSWVPASKIILEANPAFRESIWNFAPGDDPGDKAIVAAMRGKKIPQMGVIEISVMEEQQSRWLAFQKGELDILELPGVFAPMALRGDKSPPILRKQGSTCRAFSTRRSPTRLSTCAIPSSEGSRKRRSLSGGRS